MIHLTECPRDAMQGIKTWIPTATKVEYLNQLLKVGFDRLDFGSFVSPKAIPQMRDTGEIVDQLDMGTTDTDLLAIVANQRGARDAVQYEQISYLGYPFSLSETFQLRNTNATIETSLHRVSDIQATAIKSGKHVLIYLSMGFGNPYGDEWNVEIVEQWVNALYSMGIRHMSLSDTIGVSNADNIQYLFSNLIPRFSDVTFGAHLHTTPDKWEEKVNAAYLSGCRHFDGAMRGYGGCPMAADDLTGNMPTEHMISYFDRHQISSSIDSDQLALALAKAATIF
ncbi:MAG: hydroxymethylglutaryl-CoA lyase [Bacteroidota bacterium]